MADGPIIKDVQCNQPIKRNVGIKKINHGVRNILLFFSFFLVKNMRIQTEKIMDNITLLGT